METQLFNLLFSENDATDTTIKERLYDNNIRTLEDLQKLEMWELYKIKSLGTIRIILIAQLMKHHGIKFKDGRWPKRKYMRSNGKILKTSPYFKGEE